MLSPLASFLPRLPRRSAPRRRIGPDLAVLLACAVPACAMPGCAVPAWAETKPHPHHLHHAVHGLRHHHPHPAPAPAPAPPPPAPPAPAAPPASPAPPPPANKGSNTGLPLPRFAALRADDVNMRGGPGTRYPILWLYKRRDLPVEIEREFDVWRLVEDSEGVKGWVHQATLVGTRTFVVTATSPVLAGSNVRGTGTALLDDARDDAGIVAILRPGVIGRLRECPAASSWCRVTTRNYSGWLQRSAIFGVLPNEVVMPP